MIRLVVFDLDGTLVDSCGDLATGLNRALARLSPGVTPLPYERVRSFVGNGARVLIERALAATDMRAEADEVLPLFLEEYRGCMLETTAAYPGAIEALDALADRSLAVFTNKPGDLSRSLLQGLGLADRFFRILGAGDGAERKPDPGGLVQLMGGAGAGAQETVMVGDSATDVKTGRAAGVLSVAVDYGYDPKGLSAHPPDVLLHDLRGLPAVLDQHAR